MINPLFNIWYLAYLLAAMTALLLRYATMLIVVSAEELAASAYEIQGSGGKCKPGIQAIQLNFIFMSRLAHVSMQYKEYISVNI